jgi:dual specificity phosphatase 12
VVPGGVFVARCVGEMSHEATRIMTLKGFIYRTELANREHMLDHGQLGPPTPAVALSPATSRRPSTHDAAVRRSSSSSSRRPSAGALGMSRPRLGSSSGPTRPFALTPIDGPAGSGGLSAMTSMSAVDDDDHKSVGQESDVPTGPATQPQRRSGSFGTDLRSRLLAGLFSGVPNNLAMSALDTDEEESVGSTTAPSMTMSTTRTGSIDTADTVPSPNPTSGTSETILENPNSAPTTGKGRPPPALSTTSAGGGTLQHGSDLAAQLQANPKLAALRSPGGLSMTPMTPLQTGPKTIDKSSISPPILMNPKCSGYFVEPVG